MILKATKLRGCGYFSVRVDLYKIVRPSILQLVFSGILGGCANSLFSWLSTGRIGEFNPQGLISYALWPFHCFNCWDFPITAGE